MREPDRIAEPSEPTHAGNTWLGCLGVMAALVSGGISGGLLALWLGIPMAHRLGISDFEGASGTFVAFVLLPGGCLLGAAAAMTLHVALRRRDRRRGRAAARGTTTSPDPPSD